MSPGGATKIRCQTTRKNRWSILVPPRRVLLRVAETLSRKRHVSPVVGLPAAFAVASAGSRGHLRPQEVASRARRWRARRGSRGGHENRYGTGTG